METYRVRQKIADRTLRVELPEEFVGSEVEVKVTISNFKETAPTKVTKEERLAVIQRFKGIVKPPFYEPTEDEWYLQ